MELYMAAVSLPKRGRYLPLHKHHLQTQMTWTARDREDYFALLETVETLYKKGPAGLGIPRPLLEALWVEDLTVTEATNRILPYFLQCDSHRHNKVAPLHAKRDRVEVLGMAGLPPDQNGLRFAVIGKGVERLALLPWVLEAVTKDTQEEFTADDLDTLEGRSNPSLVRIISLAEKPVTSQGFAKIVAVPAEAIVNLSRTHKGEFIREVPRVWA